MHTQRLIPLACGALFIALCLFVGFRHQAKLAVSPAFIPAVAALPDRIPREPVYRSRFVSDGVTRLVHAASAVQRNDGTIQAFWFGGTREGHRDVQIYTAAYDPATAKWSQDAALITRAVTQEAELRYVKKLGNPVAAKGPDGRLWLFFVSVSLGGWSGSSINLTISEDDGQTWSKPRQLITSPLLNISTLVKGPPVFFADGSLGLPAYHEFLGKFSELLRLTRDGRIAGKVRISSGRKAIQPVIFVFDQDNALAVMRNTDPAAPRRAWSSRTGDGGRTWSRLERTPIFNKDSALGGVSTPETLICAANFSERDRSGLSLLASRDQGRTWSFLHDVEPPRRSLPPEQYPGNAVLMDQDDALSAAAAAQTARTVQCETGRPLCDFRNDYPWLMQDGRGMFHLFYTWNRALIRHVVFNAAWLEARGDKPLSLLMEREAAR